MGTVHFPNCFIATGFVPWGAGTFSLFSGFFTKCIGFCIVLKAESLRKEGGSGAFYFTIFLICYGISVSIYKSL